MTLDQLTAFFGWMTVINYAVLAFMAFWIFLLRDWSAKLHAQLFGVDPSALPQIYFSYIGTFKLLTIFLCLVPYLALRIIA